MEEEVDPEEENVCSVLDQESTELFHILRLQSPSVIMELLRMMPRDTQKYTDEAILMSLPSAVTECILNMLQYFKTANATVCCSFVQSVCMLCENIPMHLESRLMSAAGNPTTYGTISPRIEPLSPENTDGREISEPSEMDEKPSSLPSEEQISKRPRIDHWENHISAVRGLLLKRWDQLKENLVKEIQLEDVWVGLRTMNKAKDRPDETPGPADRGNRTPDSDGDYGCTESRLTLESFLQGSTGEVTVLVGQTGSGKTLLMSHLGQQWAHGLGPIPSTHLFVLLEFRQLNLLSHPLSLFELLFRYYLPPQGDEDEKRAILDYLLSNPEQSCWVLDGYDEFHSKITRKEAERNKALLDPKSLLPVADLISGLLSRQMLPGCTVVITCRIRDVTDLEGTADKMGYLLGWEYREIKEYVENFFRIKGQSANQGLGKRAVDLLFSSQHLLAMSSLPALCNICCMCLEHLLMEEKQERTRQERTVEEDQRRTEQRRNKLKGKVDRGVQAAEDRKGGSHKQQEEGEREEIPHSAQFSSLQMPSTVTQAYLTLLGAFLSCDLNHAGRDHEPKTTTLPQSPWYLLTALSQWRSELCKLSQLAWRGFLENKILFREEDIPQGVLEFSTRTGIFTQVEHRCEDGMLVRAYCFIHRTLQEFLAALRIMTSAELSDTELRKRFTLKTRWTTRSEQRTAFTDSLHLYLCGLASTHCTAALVQLAKGSGGAKGQHWVRKRQGFVLKLLEKISLSNTLTGPKILELCHCIQESQDCQLAKKVVGMRPIMELRNIRLLPKDVDALAFVVNSADDLSTGLDFRACSMEPECVDVLPRCQYIHCLSFRGRKYDDKFAEKLSSLLPSFTTLRKLEFCVTSVTDTGAASLASALQNCPDMTELNLSDNYLTDKGITHIADICTKLPRLNSVRLGGNKSSLKGVVYLIGKLNSRFQHLQADGMKEVSVTFFPNSDMKSQTCISEPTIRLLNQSWTETEMQSLMKTLARGPALSILDLSGSQWNVETLKSLAEFLSRHCITKKMMVNHSCLSIEGLLVLTALLSAYPAVMELNIRLQSPDRISLVSSIGKDQPTKEINKKLCLSYCGLLPADLVRVWKSLGPSSGITHLDLSSNSLGDKALKKLLDQLRRLNNIQEINASNNDISMEGVAMLAHALCSHHNLTEIHICNGGREQVILKFKPNTRDDEQVLKMFRLNQSSLLPADMTRLCRRLVQCRCNLELDLSHSLLKDDAIKKLLKVLPKMASLRRLNVSHCIVSTNEALTLATCLNDNQRITSVELRCQGESFICFDRVKAEQTTCRLTNFNLSSDNVGKLLKILEQGPQLSDLDLSRNHLKDEGVKYFVDSLPRLKIMNFVSLSNNCLTQQGALDVAIALSISDDVSAVEVSLGTEERCLIWFGQHGHYDKTLSLRESSLKLNHVARLAEIISNCPTLTRVELKNNLVQLDWIEVLVKLLNSSNVKCYISIEECWIKSEEAVNLVCRCLDLNSNIHTIGVHQNTLNLSLIKSTEHSIVSCDSSDQAPSLATEKISLVDCVVQGYQLLAMNSIILRCPSLTELDLTYNSLGVEGAEFLCSVLPSLPNLTTLGVCSKERNEDVVLQMSEALLQSASLQCVNLSGHMISERAAQLLARTLPRLRSVNLSHCMWSLTGRLLLMKALEQCVTLEGLCLSPVYLDADSRECLVQVLRKNTSIHRLKLNKIASGEEPCVAEGVLILLAAMEGLTQMEEIELEGWKMVDIGVEKLARFLPTWTNLRKINLSENHVGDQSGEKLLEALRSCGQLEELHLSRNKLGYITAARMALVLPLLTHLTVLNLSENCLGYEGSVSLSKAIACMKNLRKIK
ncbi:protein NLRC5 isoform X2 [Genypterus blacodes]|uniref:protein NLRC5 isoform X2 n=1 Tax=Genypterus blacodes TaxID=154954 RepID=UPI003F75D739